MTSPAIYKVHCIAAALWDQYVSILVPGSSNGCMTITYVARGTPPLPISTKLQKLFILFDFKSAFKQVQRCHANSDMYKNHAAIWSRL